MSLNRISLIPQPCKDAIIFVSKVNLNILPYSIYRSWNRVHIQSDCIYCEHITQTKSDIYKNL